MQLSQPIIDLILIFVVIEFGALYAWLRLSNRRELIPALLCFLLSGAALLAALRFALASDVHNNNMAVTAGLLALSFPLHIGTIWLMWRLTHK